VGIRGYLRRGHYLFCRWDLFIVRTQLAVALVTNDLRQRTYPVGGRLSELSGQNGA